MHAHAAAYMHLTCTCTHADSAFRVLASADKSRWRLRVVDGKRKKGKEREREKAREGVLKQEVDGCIVEAHALELDEHLSLHIRAFLSSFRSHPTLLFHFFLYFSLSFSLSLSLSCFHPSRCCTLSTFFVGLLFQKGPGLMQISS